MLKYIQENLIVIISTLSLIIAFSALMLNRKTSKLNSYNQIACYHVFLLKKGLLTQLVNKHDFNVKIYPSISSKVIPFDYSLCVRPYIGGIYRTQIFSIFDNDFSFGINKTCPLISSLKPKVFSTKKYANNSAYCFSSTPLYPYTYVLGKFDENQQKCDMQLNRYHFCIEITDYCNNTEIWYMSFSLLLSNIKDSQYKWKKCIYYNGYKYYTFHDINITSPKDIPKNFDRAATFNKSLTKIIANKEISIDSVNLMENDFDKLEYDLQLYEMKEYIEFLKRIKYNKLT